MKNIKSMPYIKSVIFGIFLIVVVLFILNFISVGDPIVILESGGYGLNDSSIKLNLTDEDSDKESVTTLPVSDFSNIYESHDELFVGEDVDYLNGEYPLFVNDNTGIVNLSSDSILIDDDFKEIDSYRFFTLSSGVLYNSGDRERADDTTYLFLYLSNGLYVNSFGITVETETKIYDIDMNSLINFEKELFNYYVLIDGEFVYREVTDIDYNSILTINSVSYSYKDFLTSLGIYKEIIISDDSEDDTNDDLNEEENFGDDYDIPYVTPEVECSNLIGNVYSVNANLVTYDPAGVITKIPTFTFYTNNTTYLRKSFYGTGVVEISGLAASTTYYVSVDWEYLTEEGETVSATCLTGEVTTKSVSSLEPIVLDFNNGEIYSNKVEIVNLQITSDLDSEALNGVRKVVLVINGTEYSIGTTNYNALLNGDTIEFSTPSILSSNQTIDYEFKFYDVNGDEMAIESGSGSTRTSLIEPSVNISFENSDIVNNNFEIELLNDDDVDIANYRYEIVSSTGEVIVSSTIESSKFTHTDLESNVLYTIYVYGDYNTNDGSGYQENAVMGSLLFATRSLTSLGYFMINITDMDISNSDATMNLSIDTTSTNSDLLELLNVLNIKIYTVDGDDIKYVDYKELTVEELNELKLGNSIEIHFADLTSDTKYFIEITTAVTQGIYEEVIQNVVDVKSFYTIKKSAVVEVTNLFATENMIDFDVKVIDEDQSVLNDTMRIEVRDSSYNVIYVDTFFTNEEELRITLEALTSESYYSVYIYAEQYNETESSSTYSNNKLLHSFSVFTEIGLSGTIQLESLEKNYDGGKNLIDIYEYVKWSETGYASNPLIEKMTVNEDENSMTLTSNFVSTTATTESYYNFGFAYDLEGYAGETTTVSFYIKLDQTSDLPVEFYIINNNSNSEVYEASNITTSVIKDEWTKVTLIFNITDNEYFGIKIKGENELQTQTKITIKDLQMEIGGISTDYEDYQFYYNANVELNLTDKNDEIQGTEYFLDIYENNELVDTLAYSDFDENNELIDVIKTLNVDSNESYRVELVIYINERQYTLDSIEFDSDNPIYSIRTVAEFVAMNKYSDYVVLNDLDFSSVTSYYGNSLIYFNGTIDFQGYTANTSTYRVNSETSEVINYFKSGGGYLFYGLGYNAEVKNLNLEYSFNLLAEESTAGISMLASYNYGTVENIRLTVTDSVIGTYSNIYGLFTYNYGTLSTFIIETKVPVYTYYNSSLIVAQNYGIVENGYIYGENMIAYSNDPTVAAYYITPGVKQNNVGGKVSNVFSLITVDLDDESRQYTRIGSIVAYNYQGTVENSYSVGDNNSPDINATPSISINNSDTSGVYYVSDYIYEGTFARKITSVALWDYTFQNNVLNDGNEETGAFNISGLLEANYYPQLIMSETMGNQVYLELPTSDDNDLIDVISTEIVEIADDYVIANINFNNPSGEEIVSIGVKDLENEFLTSQSNENGKSTITVKFSNPSQYFSEYSLMSVTTKTAYGTYYIREFEENERLLDVEFYKSIYTIDDFKLIKSYPKWNFSLESDLDFINATDYRVNVDFYGKFDGNDYTLSNIKLDAGYGLFYRTYGAEIYDVNVFNISKQDTASWGTYFGLIGLTYSGTKIDDVHMNYVFSKATAYLGGIVGYFDGTSVITNSSVDNMTVILPEDSTSDVYIGGIAARTLSSSSIYNSYVTNMDIENNMSTSRNVYIGGITGSVSGSIVNCYSTGNIDSNGGFVGGITGFISYNANTPIKNNISLIDITATKEYVGGIIGGSSTTTTLYSVENNLFLGNIYDSVDSDNVGLVIGVDTAIVINNYFYENSVLNGDKVESNGGSSSIKYESLLEMNSWKNVISLGDNYSYTDVSEGIIPKLINSYTGELLDNQVDIEVPMVNLDITELYSTRVLDNNGSYLTLEIRIDNPDSLEITDINISYMTTEITKNSINEGISYLTVKATPNYAIDSYQLSAITYLDSAGNEKTISKYYKIEEIFYNTISSYEDWQKIDWSVVAQNYLITDDIDFEGKDDVLTGIIVSRLEGVTTEVDGESVLPTLKNITFEGTANTQTYFISSITNGMSNLNFENINISYPNDTSSSVRGAGLVGNTSGTYENLVFTDVTITGTRRTVMSIFVDNTTATFNNIYLDNIYMNGYQYVSGLATYAIYDVADFATNIYAKNLTITAWNNYAGGLFATYTSYAAGSSNVQNTSNIVIEDSIIKGYNYVGGVAGNAYIYDCTIKNTTVIGYNYVGGIAGYHNSTSTILTDVYYNVIDSTIIGYTNYIGGVAGSGSHIYYANIENSNIYGIGENTSNVGGVTGYQRGYVRNATVNNTNVMATGNNVGGVVGGSVTGYTISNISVAYSYIQGANNVGGVMGATYNNTSSMHLIYITVNADVVATNVDAETGGVGGIVGYYQNEIYIDSSTSYFDDIRFVSSEYIDPDTGETTYIGTVSGNTNVGGIIGKIDKEFNINQGYFTAYFGGNIQLTESSELQFDSTDIYDAGYVYDSSLIGWYDAYNNAGNGVYNSESTTWTNLAQTGYLMDLSLGSSVVVTEGAMMFDGSVNSYAIADYDATFEDGVTIEIIYKSNTYSNAGLVGWSQQGYSSIRLGITQESSGTISPHISSSTSSSYSRTTVYNGYTPSEINYVTYTVGDSGSTAYTYINGILEATQTSSQTLPFTTVNDFRVGSFGSSTNENYSGYYLNGEIYTIRVYNRVLSEEEIQQNYEADLIRYDIGFVPEEVDTGNYDSEFISFGIGSNSEYNNGIKLYVNENSKIGILKDDYTTWNSVSTTSNNSYISDNLVVWYDGINNTGIGHSDSTLIWKDLSGNNNDAYIQNYNDNYLYWNESSLQFNSTSTNYYALIPKLDVTDEYTVEIFFDTPTRSSNTYSTLISSVGTSSKGFAAGLGTNSKLFFVGDSNSYASNYKNDTYTSITFVYSDIIGGYGTKQVYADGELVYQGSNLSSEFFDTELYLGIGSWNYIANREIYSVRIYDDALSGAEIMSNYELDTRRYLLEEDVVFDEEINIDEMYNIVSSDDMSTQSTYTNMMYNSAYNDYSVLPDYYPLIKQNSSPYTLLNYQEKIGILDTPSINNYALTSVSMRFNSYAFEIGYDVYQTGVDKINIEFDEIYYGATFKLISGDYESDYYTINQQVYTFDYDYLNDIEIEFKYYYNVYSEIVEKNDLSNNILVLNNNNYAYISEGILYYNNLEVGSGYVNLYGNCALDEDGNIYDLNTSEEIIRPSASLSLNDDVATLYSFELDGTIINTFYNFSEVINDDYTNVVDDIFLVKNGVLSVIDNTLNIFKDTINLDYYNEKSYEVMLSNSNQIYSLKSYITYPDNFDNSEIKDITSNVLVDSNIILVEYENGKIIGFNYTSGDVLFTLDSTEEVSLFAFIADEVTSAISGGNDIELAPLETYNDSLILEQTLISEPLNEIIDNEYVLLESEAIVSSSTDNYIISYNAETKSYDVYNQTEILTNTTKELVSENYKIDSSNKLTNYYNSLNEMEPINYANSIALIILIIIAICIAVVQLLVKNKILSNDWRLKIKNKLQKKH
ncbi:MAG: LamG-like jellyroll fold domain-containing protein [Mycoplasmatota bacterium]